MPKGVLANKQICIVHPQTIHDDVRLHKAVRALSKAEAEITIACIEDMNENSGELEKFAKIWRIPRAPHYFPSSKHPVWLVRVLYNILIANLIQKIQGFLYKNDPLQGMAQRIAQKNFDAVHFINYNSTREALRLQKISGAPYIYETYECWQKILQNKKWLKREAECVQNASAAIVVSEPIREVYSKYAPQTPVMIIYNVAPSAPLPPTEVHQPIRFYLQSFLRRHYGIEIALKTFSKVKGDFTVTIQGPAHEPGYLNELMSLKNELELNKRVIFAEPCSYENAVEVANQHDVGFLFFPEYIDGAYNYNGEWSLPNKLFVYSSAGLAMLFSKFQIATKELIKKSNAALFVNGDDENSIASILQGLIDNPKQIDLMKRASYKWAQQFTQSTEETKLTNLYSSLFSKE